MEDMLKKESLNTNILDEVADFMGKVHNLLEILKKQETNSYSDKQAYEILYMAYKVDEFQHILENYKSTVDGSSAELSVKTNIIDNINIMLRKLEIVSKSISMLKILLNDTTIRYYDDNKDNLDSYISKFSVFNSSNKITVSKVIEEEIVIEKPKLGNLSVSEVLYSSCLFAVSASIAMIFNGVMPLLLGFVDSVIVACGYNNSFFDEAYNPGFTSMVINRMSVLIWVLWVIFIFKLLITFVYVKIPKIRRFIPKFLVNGIVKKSIKLYGIIAEKHYVKRNLNLIEQGSRVLKSLYSYSNLRCFGDAFKIVTKLNYKKLSYKELNILVQVELLAEYVNRMEYNKSFFEKVDTSFIKSKGIEIYKSLLLV